MQWKEARLKPESSILESIKVIDQQSFKAAFIVVDDWVLKGMVTDGDIRRGLLSGLTLDDPVSKAMNPSPLTCSPNDNHETIRRLMEAKQLLHMPIVNDRRLVDVLTLRQLSDKPRLENPVFLMAGGYGERLRPLTKSCPKPLFKNWQQTHY